MLNAAQKARGAPFGTLVDGRPARLYRLRSPRLDVDVTDYGARIVAIRLRSGDGRSVVLGFDDVAGYEADTVFHGACIGRYANRIGGAHCVVDGRAMTLAANDGPNTLHGGPDGFFARLWDVSDADDDALTLTLHSPDGDQGFAGGVDVSVRFTVADGRLTITYEAAADAPTPFSLSHHPYFNLAGGGRVDDHALEAEADAFTPSDAGGAPTGAIISLDAEPALDLRESRRVGDIIAVLSPRGLDQNYVMRPGGVARLREPTTGRTLTVSSDMPAMQIYTGGGLNGGPPPL